mmetsp:Transcript_27174/g.78299  ORF Transcript_27174/g.78299 Transcript_27174/m.78299 type:complete len:355 (-) Transcript_27174:206-1270(-)
MGGAARSRESEPWSGGPGDRGPRWLRAALCGVAAALLLLALATRADDLPSRAPLPPGAAAQAWAARHTSPTKYQAAYISWAEHPNKCLHVSGRPHNGTHVQIWDCSLDQSLITTFLLPVGAEGPIRLVSHPHLCLDACGFGRLRLWSCGAGELQEGMKFVVRPEASAWAAYPHFDIPDESDAEQMNASDIDAVRTQAVARGYAGFSVFKGLAWFKGVQQLSKSDLHYMGKRDNVVFHVFRPKGEVTIRAANNPNTCMGVAWGGTNNGDKLRMSMCGPATSSSRIADMRFNLHVVRGPAQEPTVDGSGGREGAEVAMSMSIDGVNYDQLLANPKLFSSFRRVIKEVVAEEVEHGG